MRLRLFSRLAIGVDLGTANTLISLEGKILLNEPSIVAIDPVTNQLLATGSITMLMHEKSGTAIKTIKPLRDGVIADFSAAELMIKSFTNRISKESKNLIFSSYTMLFSVPIGITDVEKRAIRDSAVNSGASEVLMIYEPMASAVGAGLDVMSAEGILIVDIGGGTTQAALISLGGIVVGQSIRTAGNTFNNDIAYYIKKEYNLLIGERTAEALKIKIGTVLVDLDEDDTEFEVVGRDLLSGIPKSIKISFSETALALDRSIAKIEESIIKVLENSPPELASDIHINGFYISGGGSLLRGLKERLGEKLGLKVILVDNPLNSVIKGTSIILNDKKKYSCLIFK